MLKKSLVSLGVSALILSSLGSGSVFAKEQTKASGLTQQQLVDVEKGKAATKKFQLELESGKAIVVPDKKATNSLVSNIASADSSPASSRKGTFYVTSDATSSNSIAWAGGHAAMVYSSYYTIEAWGNQGAALNGVNLWSNNWKTKYTHFKALSVSSTTVAQDAAAGDKAFSYAGYKPYNFNFFNINQDNSFYCSQLVWYAFKKTANVDLNDGGAVWPVDLTESNNVYSFYAQ